MCDRSEEGPATGKGSARRGCATGGHRDTQTQQTGGRFVGIAFLKPARFDLCNYGGLLVLLMWPGGCPHPQELGFSLLPPEASTFTLPAHDDGRVAVHLAVVEQTTGIVVGLNELTWPPHFTLAVHQQLQLRARHPMADQDAITAATAAMRAQYPNSIDLMDRSIAHCTAD